MPIIVYKSDIAAAKLQYKEFLAGKAGSFTTGLFDLIPKADILNRRKLAVAFPEHVFVYMQHVGELDRMTFAVKEA